MPSATIEDEIIGELSKVECLVKAKFVSNVMENSKVEERVNLNNEGKRILLEMKVTR